jgi:hypothetical protein
MRCTPTVAQKGETEVPQVVPEVIGSERCLQQGVSKLQRQWVEFGRLETRGSRGPARLPVHPYLQSLEFPPHSYIMTREPEFVSRLGFPRNVANRSCPDSRDEHRGAPTMCEIVWLDGEDA